jgi:hypothetical protein
MAFQGPRDCPLFFPFSLFNSLQFGISPLLFSGPFFAPASSFLRHLPFSGPFSSPAITFVRPLLCSGPFSSPAVTFLQPLLFSSRYFSLASTYPPRLFSLPGQYSSQDNPPRTIQPPSSRRSAFINVGNADWTYQLVIARCLTSYPSRIHSPSSVKVANPAKTSCPRYVF